MQDVMDIAKALADPGRARILLALADGELCVCQLVSLLELAPSTVSRHVAILRRAGLVVSRKKGRWVYYRRPDEGASAPVESALKWLDDAAGHGQDARRDRARLEEILRLDPEALCRTVLR